MHELSKNTMLSDPDVYEYSPYNARPKIKWPNGARVAFWVAPNIEFYELFPPIHPTRKDMARPAPDIQFYAHRDYGNRVGLWRLMDVMDRYDVRGSVSLNVAVCDHHPEIIEACLARNWELFSHGVYNTRFQYGMSEDQHREFIEDVIATVKKHSGQKVAGWLSPALSNTEMTLDLLAEYGVLYTCDLFHDDQPQPVKVKKGRLISMPYAVEMNDIMVFQQVAARSPRHYLETLKAQFDQLYEEGAENGTVMCIPLHPFLIGQPHRIGPFADALEYITGHDDVWVTTGREIAEWYYAHHYDEVVGAQMQRIRK
jgi:allantoinase